MDSFSRDGQKSAICDLLVEKIIVTFSSYEKVLVLDRQNFRLDRVLGQIELDQIGLKFGTPLEGPKRKDEFINKTIFTNGSGFIHKKSFFKNQNFHSPDIIYEIQQKCQEIKFFTSERSTIFLVTIFSQELYFLFISDHLLKNFWFPTKLYEIFTKKMLKTKLFISNRFANLLQSTF